MAYFFWRINALAWAELVEKYALLVLVTYLTDVWNLGVIEAAGLINIWEGITKAMPLGFLFLRENFTGHYWMRVISSTCSSIGLGLLTMSTPPALSTFNGTCSEYSSECIGHTQVVIFYVALTLIALGKSGREAFSLKLSLNQVAARNLSDNDVIEAIFLVIVYLIAAIGLPYIKPWSVRFGIPAIFTLVATLLFLSGSCSYKSYFSESEIRSPLTTVFRVFTASASKIFKPLPTDDSQLYMGEDQSLLRTPTLRCLDKAAIILPCQSDKRSSWRLCSIQEVEETKIVLGMLPLCLIFIICGVVSSIGKTYFVAQAKNLNPKFLKIDYTVAAIHVIHDNSKKYMIEHSKRNYKNSRNCPRSEGLLATIVYATICCIIAALVETKRLGVIRSHGFVDKPNEIIPMSIFWLVPQFYCLGFVDGIFERSVDSFFSDECPPSMKAFAVFFSKGVVGLGTASSVLSVYFVGKVSEIGGNPNWFQQTLNKSHLNYYYWVLAGICFLTLVLWVVVSRRVNQIRNRAETDYNTRLLDDTNEP